MSAGSTVVTTAVTVLIVALIVACIVRATIRGRIVRANSALVRAAGELRTQYGYLRRSLPRIRYSFDMEALSKAAFDRFDLEAFYHECLLDREHEIAAALQAHEQRTHAFAEYESRFAALRDLRESPPATKLSPKAFTAIEERLYRFSKLRLAKGRAHVNITVRYSSPQGRNSYARSHRENFDQFRASFESARSAAQRQSIARRQRERERLLMTAGLRYAILKRDGHRCRSCGASAAQGATLHIDHIRPVSRGGKSTLDNRQALCEACNLGKGSRA